MVQLPPPPTNSEAWFPLHTPEVPYVDWGCPWTSVTTEVVAFGFICLVLFLSSVIRAPAFPPSMWTNESGQHNELEGTEHSADEACFSPGSRQGLNTGAACAQHWPLYLQRAVADLGTSPLFPSTCIPTSFSGSRMTSLWLPCFWFCCCRN